MKTVNEYKQLVKDLRDMYITFNLLHTLENPSEYNCNIQDMVDSDIFSVEQKLMKLTNELTVDQIRELFPNTAISYMGKHETCEDIFAVHLTNGVLLEFEDLSEVHEFCVKFSQSQTEK